MAIRPDELLARMAVTLRRDIGPAVAEPFPKTQAFMASVVLDKLARQMAAAAGDEQAATDDHAALVAELAGLSAVGRPAPWTAAFEAFSADASGAAWNALIEATYANRDQFGEEAFPAIITPSVPRCDGGSIAPWRPHGDHRPGDRAAHRALPRHAVRRR